MMEHKIASPIPAARRSPWRASLAGVAAVLTLLGASSVLVPATVASAATATVLDGRQPSGYESINGDGPVELGMQFMPTRSGVVTAVRFYKANPAANTTPSSASVWDAAGRRLAQVAIAATTRTGWLSATLTTPVKMSSGAVYTTSVYAQSGSYIATRNGFSAAIATSSASIPLRAGVYTYGRTSRFPASVYRSSNYWIDAVMSTDVPTSTPTPTVTRTASPTPTPTVTRTASPTSTPTTRGTAAGLMGWQLNASNVGLAQFGLTCDQLPVYTGSLRPAAGARISGVRIIGNLDLRNGDIVVERSCIRPGSGTGSLVTNYVCGADDCPVISEKSIVIRDSEFDASTVPASQIAGSCAFRGTGTLQRNYMHGMGSGICFYGTGMKHEAIAEQNYVTDMRSYGGSHNEAATIRDFMLDQNPNRIARFTQNRFDIASGNVTAGLFIQPTWDDIDTLVVEGNLIEGGGYNLFLNASHGSYQNVRAINNRFRSTGWGPSTVMGGPGWAQWSNNYMYDATKADARGALVNPN